MAEATIITRPYKPDGSPSRARLKTTTIPDTTYDNSETQNSVKRMVTHGSIFDKYPTKLLKSFTNSILSLKSNLFNPSLSDTEVFTKNNDHSTRVLKKPESATAMEIYEKHQEDTKILKEYELLVDYCPPGVYTIPSIRSIQVWHGIIFVRSGIYEQGGFRFDLFIPDGFPKQWPLVRFRSFVFHPQVSMVNGSLNVPEKFKIWIPDSSHIWELLLYIYDSFYEIELDNAVNEKASTMYRDDIARYRRKARECVKQAVDEMRNCSDSVDVEVYGDESNLLCYEEYSEDRLNELKALMIAEEVPEFDEKPSNGVFSWLGDNLSKPLSSVFSI